MIRAQSAMSYPLRHLVLVLLCSCASLVLHNSSCMDAKGWWEEADQDKLSVVNIHERALQVYMDLVLVARQDSPECAFNHSQRYEVLNQSIAYHWNACLSTAPAYNIHLLQTCMEDRARGDMDILLHNIKDIRDCIIKEASQVSPGEAEWAQQVAEVRGSLSAVRANNALYVAVENARLAHRTHCHAEFAPLVQEFAANIEHVVASCLKFVPAGRREELRRCCEDLVQPTLSDVQSKLMYVAACVEQPQPART